MKNKKLIIQEKFPTLPCHINNKCVNIFQNKLYSDNCVRKILKCHGPNGFVSCNMLLGCASFGTDREHTFHTKSVYQCMNYLHCKLSA